MVKEPFLSLRVFDFETELGGGVGVLLPQTLSWVFLGMSEQGLFQRKVLSGESLDFW